MAGCLEERYEGHGDRIIVKPHWAQTLVPVGVGVALVVVGVLLQSGRLRPTAKPRASGGFLVVLGLLFAVGAGLTIPFSRVTADSEGFAIHEGFLGRGISRHVEMDTLESIDVYQQKISARTSRQRIVAQFNSGHGPPILIRIDYTPEGWGHTTTARTRALNHFLKLASERGIAVSDRRSQPSDAPPSPAQR